MIETLAGPQAGGADDLTARDLLALARAQKTAEDRAAADLLVTAARWADLHPPESIHDAAAFTVPGCEHEEPIAGEGAPLVAEFCLAELGTVLGISTTAAKKLVGHALELRHRLPRLWAQVHAGRVPAWRARMVADATIHATPALTREAAAFVDAQAAAVAGRIGQAQLDRLVAETIKRYDLAGFDPAQDPEDGYLHVDPRHATVHDDDVHFAGTMRMEAELDIADALDLDRVLAHGAASLKALGSDRSLDARRAAALGDLARTQTALDLHAQGATGARNADGLPAAREVVLHAHFDATLDGLATVFGPTGRMEEGQRLVLLDQVRDWCGDSRTKVTMKPVIDLNADLATPAYEVPERIREQVILRDRTCVFPWCTRPARGCDIDHVIPHDPDADAKGPPQPGPTTTQNLAALCRFHHRLKTHTAWRYRMVEPGVVEWTSPHGHRYRRDGAGTTAVDQAERPDIPRPRRP
ncbi:HNH endonuclease signature motif containing protein [Microvirga sp. 0TCS3.31]